MAGFDVEADAGNASISQKRKLLERWDNEGGANRRNTLAVPTILLCGRVLRMAQERKEAPRLHRANAWHAWRRRFANVLDNIPQMLWIGGPSRDDGFCNKALHEFVGADPGTLTARNRLTWVHPDDRRRIKISWKEAVSEGRTFESELRLAHHLGGYRWILSCGAPVFNVQGGIDAWLGTAIDIDRSKTAELQLALNAERFRALHQASSMVLWIATPDGGVVEEWGWTNLSEQAEGEFRGWGWLDAVHPDDRNRTVARWMESLASGASYREEFRIASRGGEFRWVEAQAVPLRADDGSVREWVGRLSDIHERKQGEHSLQISEERLRLAVESTRLGVWDADLVSGARQWNEQARAVLGLSTDTEITRESFRARVHPDDRDQVEQRFFINNPTDGSVYSGEYRIIRADNGEERWVAATGTTIVDEDGNPIRKIGTVRDITQEKQAVRALESSERRLRLATQAARMVAWEEDLDTSYVTRSANAKGLLGIGSGPLDELLARIHPEDRSLRRDFLKHKKERATIEVRYRGPGNEPLWLSIRGERAGPRRLLGVTFDITAQKQSELEIARMAREDSLTGLLNRATFQMLLDQRCQRAAAAPFSLILLDLDHFKDVNDALGHDAGDHLLKEAASRMISAVGSRGIVARFGGDEFAILLHDHASSSTSIAVDVLESLRSPATIRGRAFSTRASIGVAQFPSDGRNAEDLLKSADIALYRAKTEGRNRSVIYAPAMRQSVEERFSVFEDLRRGLEEGEIVSYYQPKVSLETGRLVGFEALARWHHKTRGLCTPEYFGIAFDDPELARAIGERVLDQSLTDMKVWREMGYDPGRIAINISSSGFHSSDLADLFFDRLARLGLPASVLEIEITEAVFLDRMSSDPAHTLQRFHEAGVSIALDDFGTGFASLSHLKRFPIDHVKIDMSFIQDVESDRDDEAIISAIVDLGHRLQMQVTAEGVETKGQADKLRQMGCDNAQGFLFAPALSAKQAHAYLERSSLAANGHQMTQLGSFRPSV